jgi:hypothetical protein
MRWHCLYSRKSPTPTIVSETNLNSHDMLNLHGDTLQRDAQQQRRPSEVWSVETLKHTPPRTNDSHTLRTTFRFLIVELWKFSVQIMNLLVLRGFPFSCHFIPVRSTYSSQQPVLKTPSICSFSFKDNYATLSVEYGQSIEMEYRRKEVWTTGYTAQ